MRNGRPGMTDMNIGEAAVDWVATDLPGILKTQHKTKTFGNGLFLVFFLFLLRQNEDF